MYNINDKTTLKIDETYTDDNGEYIFNNYSAWAEIAIIAFGPLWTALYQTYSVRIYPVSSTFRVGKDWVGVNLLDAFNDWTLGVISKKDNIKRPYDELPQ